MQLIPAIDLLNGRCVRLLHGDFDQCKVYEASAVDLARRYFEAGSDILHVVDLAASRDGADADSSPLFHLLRNAPQKVQTGGGVRCENDIIRRLDNGAERVVIGSLCVTEPGNFKSWLKTFGADQLVAALDIRRDAQGVPFPRIYGWTEASDRSLWSLLDEFTGEGLKHLLCTDISRDGAMTGPNTALYKEIVERYPSIHLQASGGVASLDDLRTLRTTGATGAITGKALLEGRFSVGEALEAIA
jgi:phosphoribosylformimino-5-aminoimidazole carboxamide ribotide isomerase